MHSLHIGRVGAKVFYKTGIEDTSFFSLLNRLKAEFNDVSCDL